MHVAMTRAEERLILSGAARLGDSWPQPSPGVAPISWMAPALVPGVAALDPGDAGPRPRRRAPVLDARRAACCASRRPRPVAPGAQLALALDAGAGAAPAPAPAPAEPSRRRPRRPRRSATRRSRATPSAPTAGTWSAASGCPSRRRPAPARRRRAGARRLDRACAARWCTCCSRSSTCAPARAPPGADGRARRRRRARRELSDADVADLRRMVAAFADSALRARLAAAPAVRREPPSPSRSADGPLLNGFVDVLAFEADGRALVVDYKSDRIGDADLEALVEAALRRAAAIYALAALRAGAPAVEVAHLFLERPAEPAVARYEQADAETLEAELRDAAAPLLAGEFPVRAVPASRAVRDVPRPRGPVLATRRELDRPRAGASGVRRPRERCGSALSSAPKRNALAEMHSQSSNTIAPAHAIGRAVAREVRM